MVSPETKGAGIEVIGELGALVRGQRAEQLHLRENLGALGPVPRDARARVLAVVRREEHRLNRASQRDPRAAERGVDTLAYRRARRIVDCEIREPVAGSVVAEAVASVLCEVVADDVRRRSSATFWMGAARSASSTTSMTRLGAYRKSTLK